MSDKKQTAVEWLITHWKKLQSEHTKMSWDEVIAITELAKALEMEQIELALPFAEYFRNNFEYYDCNASGRVYKWIDLTKRGESAMTMKQIYDYWQSKYASEYYTKNYGDNVNPDLQKP